MIPRAGRHGWIPALGTLAWLGVLLTPRTSAAQTPPASPSSTAPAVAPAPPETAPPESPESAPSAKPAAVINIDALGAHEITWDANIEGAFGRGFGDDHNRAVAFGRVRGGLLWGHAPWFTSIGAFYDLSNFTSTFGIQIEQMHLQSGLWIQAGAGVDIQPRAMAMVAVGWSVVGVEMQYRALGDAGIGPALFGKLRIPLGIIGYALRSSSK